MVVRQVIILVLVLLEITSASAQRENAAGFAVELTKKWKFPRAWAISVGPGFEYRPYFNGSQADISAPPTVRNLDINAAVERRWLEHWRFGSAVRLRSRYPLDEMFRATEVRTWLYAERIIDVQYFRIAQRFRTEQRWRGEPGDPLELSLRHRYRIGFEHALAGRRVDPNEWFIILTCEVLVPTGSFAERPGSIDIRPLVNFGRGKLQLGVEYRHESDLYLENIRSARTLLGVVQYAL